MTVFVDIDLALVILEVHMTFRVALVQLRKELGLQNAPFYNAQYTKEGQNYTSYQRSNKSYDFYVIVK